LNPGSPTPQAGILNQSSHIRNQYHHQTEVNPMETPNVEAIRRPQPRIEFTDQIIKKAVEKTLQELKKNGKSNNTIRSVSYSLRKLQVDIDLHDREALRKSTGFQTTLTTTNTAHVTHLETSLRSRQTPNGQRYSTHGSLCLLWRCLSESILSRSQRKLCY